MDSLVIRTPPKVALLSTGDELVNGDVMNTNSQIIAQRLFDLFIQPGMHLTVSDDQTSIEKAIQFLLTDHQALIITGGLGPTSDDRTRFALASATNTHLVFNEKCWEWIVERLNRLSLPIPDTNRQQCLFPANALIFPNENGTAAACQVMHGHQVIFMLPGPPFECFPILERAVLPYLQTHNFAYPEYAHQWLLWGASEGSVAEKLDPVIASYTDCSVGYRVNQPYLEVKLRSQNPEIFTQLMEQFEILIGDQSISTHKQKASEQLQRWITEKNCLIHIEDEATGGLLAYTLLNPDTCPFLDFSSRPQAHESVRMRLMGLKSFWQKQSDPSILEIDFQFKKNKHHVNLTIPYRKERTPLFAVELACWELLNYLKLLRTCLHIRSDEAEPLDF